MSDIYIVYQKENPDEENFAFFRFRTTLDEVDYVLRFMWNTRMSRWVMGIYDADETPLKIGLPLHVNSNLNGRFVENNLPQGVFMLFDTSGENEECGFDDFGDRCVLLYQNLNA